MTKVNILDFNTGWIRVYDIAFSFVRRGESTIVELGRKSKCMKIWKIKQKKIYLINVIRDSLQSIC